MSLVPGLGLWNRKIQRVVFSQQLHSLVPAEGSDRVRSNASVDDPANRRAPTPCPGRPRRSQATRSGHVRCRPSRPHGREAEPPRPAPAGAASQLCHAVRPRRAPLHGTGAGAPELRLAWTSLPAPVPVPACDLRGQSLVPGPRPAPERGPARGTAALGALQRGGRGGVRAGLRQMDPSGRGAALAAVLSPARSSLCGGRHCPRDQRESLPAFPRGPGRPQGRRVDGDERGAGVSPQMPAVGGLRLREVSCVVGGPGLLCPSI